MDGSIDTNIYAATDYNLNVKKPNKYSFKNTLFLFLSLMNKYFANKTSLKYLHYD